MNRVLSFAIFSLLATRFAFAGVVDGTNSPSVKLDNGVFNGVSQGPVNLFLGIPYAKPPVGDLRFRLPVANDPYNGTFNVSEFGLSCIEQIGTGAPLEDLNPTAAQILQELLESAAPSVDGEDCLFVNVYTPANMTRDARLPVIFWIYGGGFEDGSSNIYNGSVIVERSIELNIPAIYVSFNYRISALGFPGSAEVREAGIGNMGLFDQRLALRWVQKYIHNFGGDSAKVMIWGESAGSTSVALHMLTNGGNSEGLFRAAIMNSGSPLVIGQLEDGQSYFDQFAADSGCGDSLGSAAVFDCLRQVPESSLRTAINNSPNVIAYQGLNIPWFPRIDGKFIVAHPQQLVLQNQVAKVPFVTGDCDDEGTLFSLANSNITTDEEFQQYVAEFYLPDASPETIAGVLSLYPSDPSAGSPFGTGSNNSITPQFKRIAAFVGDFTFQAPRRFFLEQRSGKQFTYSFLSKREKSTPVLGSAHGTDLNNVYGPGDMTDYLVRFAANLDPNGNTDIHWPRYSVDSPKLLTFLDGEVTLELTEDTYRAEAFKAITAASLNSTSF